jgi:RNA-binding protein YhbY
MPVFEKEEPRLIINDVLIDEYDRALEREQLVLAKIVQSTDRTDDHVLLNHHIGETRQLLVALREKTALLAFYRSRINR